MKTTEKWRRIAQETAREVQLIDQNQNLDDMVPLEVAIEMLCPDDYESPFPTKDVRTVLDKMKLVEPVTRMSDTEDEDAPWVRTQSKTPVLPGDLRPPTYQKEGRPPPSTSPTTPLITEVEYDILNPMYIEFRDNFESFFDKYIA